MKAAVLRLHIAVTFAIQAFAKLPSRSFGLAGQNKTFDYVVRVEALSIVHSIIAD